MNRVVVPLAAVILLATALSGCRSLDVSFKTVTIEGAQRDRAFDVCHDVITSRFSGTVIRSDKAAGRIETDPIEEPIGGKALREQCYVQIRTLEDGTLEVAVMARMQQLVVTPGEENPVLWKDVGSDLQVEAILLDEISGRILALEPDANVIATTLPPDARVR